MQNAERRFVIDGCTFLDNDAISVCTVDGFHYGSQQGLSMCKLGNVGSVYQLFVIPKPQLFY